MGGLERAEPAERMLCFNVGGFLQACNVKKPPYIGNNGYESPARRYKMNEFILQKTLGGAHKFFPGAKRRLRLSIVENLSRKMLIRAF